MGNKYKKNEKLPNFINSMTPGLIEGLQALKAPSGSREQLRTLEAIAELIPLSEDVQNFLAVSASTTNHKRDLRKLTEIIYQEKCDGRGE